MEPSVIRTSAPLLGEVAPFYRRRPVDDILSFACLGIALVFAAITRLGWPGLVQFEYDESWALSVASSIARGQALPLVGIGSSLNVPNAPFFVYLMALPELLGRDPSTATAFVGLLGAGAVAATYGFARSLFDPIAAGAAAILYAVSPWGIIYSRKVWEQDTLPIFVTLGFWALFTSLLRGKPRLLAPGVVLLALATQLHPTAFFLAVPAAVLVIGSVILDRARSASIARWLAIGLLVALVTEAPFIVWQAGHGWPTIAALGHAGGDHGQFDLTAFRLAASAVAGNGYPLQAQAANPWKLASLIEAGLLVLGSAALGAQALRSGRGAPRAAALAILAWLATPILAQIHHGVPLYPHYFIVLYPAAFVVMGVGVATLWGAGPHPLA
ncbi:MAG: ArnT family glycosyltransferase, partial [Chloroflexota bacterium]